MIPFNPFGLSLMGLDIVEAPQWPKYKLPDDFPCTPEFRKDFDAWALEFFGTTSNVEPGVAYILNGRTMIAHPRDIVKLIKIAG